MQSWLDLAADGRKVVLMLDHLELYRKTPEEYAAWKHNDQPPYQLGPAGQRQFMSQVEATPPDGQTLLRRVEQIKKAQQRMPVPMILIHPFTMRLENIQRTAKATGRDLKTLTVDEYRFFHADERQRLANALKGSSIYLEISNSTEYCRDLGCNSANTNTILRELLALRAKKIDRPRSIAGSLPFLNTKEGNHAERLTHTPDRLVSRLRRLLLWPGGSCHRFRDRCRPDWRTGRWCSRDHHQQIQ
jgi:hypothetical protein